MSATRILLAPGASGTIEGLRQHERGLVARGLDVRLVDLPRGRAERALPVYGNALDDEDAAATVVGGHSFGGRVASLLAAERDVAGLVLLSYPLHAPGRREAWDERTAHWPRITIPVLLLSGESDPFADLTLLRGAVEKLPNHTLITYPRVGHGLAPVLDPALDQVADFIRRHT
ncbi:MAG: dienelactone hydrolase family protein [Chloroflexi bacterium]|nr:dienelactone hydrolase family protein [Chloroflexota bacterium]